MRYIQTNEELEQFCCQLNKSDCIAVDTEFLREKTYYPQLCLVQLATKTDLACVDALTVDLSPLFEVMRNPKILKVFHSARQDLEIFFYLMHAIPFPVFDTQIGAMVCGLGENVSYHHFIQHFLHINLDKASRLTDWSARPLTEKQLKYAIGDVEYLIQAYPLMRSYLEKNNRLSWLQEEMQALQNPRLYEEDPNEMWKRLKLLSHRPQYLGLLQALCAWREYKARELNRPRKQILRDEVILELATLEPKQASDFSRLRSSYGTPLKSVFQAEILQLITQTMTKKDFPTYQEPTLLNQTQQTTKELLKMLLNIVCLQQGVAPKLIADSNDLDKLAIHIGAQVPAMSGWRYEIFGKIAQDFIQGRVGITFNPQQQQLEIK